MAVPDVAALIGSDLRSFNHFSHRIDNLLEGGEPYDVFISTDAKSLACARAHGLLPRPRVQWAGESPDTDASMLQAFGRLPAGVSPHHLHQWWRLHDAWRAMTRHEKHGRGGKHYGRVVRLRTDMRLPRPLNLGGELPVGTLVMRGDWIFWGPRAAVRVALSYVDALPLYYTIGQRAYIPLPYRHMVAVGPSALSAGLVGWLKYPLNSLQRPFGFAGHQVGSPSAIIHHARQHLDALEAFHASGKAARLTANELVSVRDAWWRWDGIPDNEKFFFFHVLNNSLWPRNMLDLYNQGVHNATLRVSFLGKADGLLLPSRHHANCTD